MKRRRPVARSLRLGPTAPVDEARVLAEGRDRVRWLALALAAFLVVLAGRAAQLTMLKDERLQTRGDQYRSTLEMKGRRGALQDRTGRLVAVTVDLPTLYADPRTASDADLERWLPRLAAITGRPEAWIRERFDAGGGNLRRIELASSLEPEEVRPAIRALRAEYKETRRRDALWFWSEDEPVRLYPGRELAAPLLGFTDASDDGVAGLEKLLNRELEGDTYRVLQARDRKGRAIDMGVDDDRLGRSGHGVRLTLDMAIQHATEESLERAMIASQPEAAMAVVLDIRSGAILAMASLPSGNPNANSQRADLALFKNRPALDQIEPGSVFKPFVAAAALEEGIVTPETTIDCELGAWVVGGKTIKDDHPKGVISVTEVIKYSSNIGAAKLGMKLGAERTLKYLKDFGFARGTGLGLPGEVAGQMRNAATIRPIELATTSFGQGVTASPVQLAAAVATIANGGVRMAPRLVDALIDRAGTVEAVREPRTDRRVISEDTAAKVAAMMQTVTEEGGTGTRAAVPGYKVAGKTGTAQKVENGAYHPTKRIGSFVGFIPADRPVLAIAVTVDSPTVGSRYGGIVAAPAFAEIATFSMRYLGIPADPPVETEPAAESVVATVSAPAPIELRAAGDGSTWIMPDLAGRSMRASLAGLQAGGFDLDVRGSGRLVEQVPAPGSRLSAGDPVKLRFD